MAYIVSSSVGGSDLIGTSAVAGRGGVAPVLLFLLLLLFRSRLKYLAQSARDSSSLLGLDPSRTFNLVGWRFCFPEISCSIFQVVLKLPFLSSSVRSFNWCSSLLSWSFWYQRTSLWTRSLRRCFTYCYGNFSTQGSWIKCQEHILYLLPRETWFRLNSCKSN